MTDGNPYRPPVATAALAEAEAAAPLAPSQMHYAGFLRRAVARLVDTLVLLVAMIGSLWVLRLLIADPDPRQTLLGVLIVAIGALYVVGMHGTTGQTLGKWLTRIEVRLLSGARLTSRGAFLRYSVELALGLLQLALAKQSAAATSANVVQLLMGLWFLAEVIVFWGNEKRRAIHDFMGGTVVVHKVRTHAAGQPPVSAPVEADDVAPKPGAGELPSGDLAAARGPDDRVLCSDGNCIGLLGVDGHCKVCGISGGAPSPNGPEAARGG